MIESEDKQLIILNVPLDWRRLSVHIVFSTGRAEQRAAVAKKKRNASLSNRDSV